MHTIWSGHFDSVTKLQEQYRYVQELGMDFLKIPRDMYDLLSVAPEAVTLYAVLPAGKQKIITGRINELSLYVANNPATYQLRFTV